MEIEDLRRRIESLNGEYKKKKRLVEELYGILKEVKRQISISTDPSLKAGLEIQFLHVANDIKKRTSELKSIEQKVQDLRQRLRALQSRVGASNKSVNKNSKNPNKSDLRKFGEHAQFNTEASRKVVKPSTDPLDRSVFGLTAVRSALQSAAQKREAATALDKLAALKPFNSVFEQAPPEKKSLAEAFYPDMDPKPENPAFARRRKDGLRMSHAEALYPDGFPDDDYDLVEIKPEKTIPWGYVNPNPDPVPANFKRVRKDGQRLSHAEALYPDGFPDDNYDLVEIKPVEPIDPWDDNPFKQAELRRKKKKKLF